MSEERVPIETISAEEWTGDDVRDVRRYVACYGALGHRADYLAGLGGPGLAAGLAEERAGRPSVPRPEPELGPAGGTHSFRDRLVVERSVREMEELLDQATKEPISPEGKLARVLFSLEGVDGAIDWVVGRHLSALRPEETIGLGEASELLGMDREDVRAAVARGAIFAESKGKALFFRRGDIFYYVDRKKRTG